jgi:hypothetical protein
MSTWDPWKKRELHSGFFLFTAAIFCLQPRIPAPDSSKLLGGLDQRLALFHQLVLFISLLPSRLNPGLNLFLLIQSLLVSFGPWLWEQIVSPFRTAFKCPVVAGSLSNS